MTPHPCARDTGPARVGPVLDMVVPIQMCCCPLTIRRRRRESAGAGIFDLVAALRRNTAGATTSSKL